MPRMCVWSNFQLTDRSFLFSLVRRTLSALLPTVLVAPLCSSLAPRTKSTL